MKLLRGPLMLIISFFIVGISFIYYVDVYEVEHYVLMDWVLSEYKKPVSLEELNKISDEEKARRRKYFEETNKECYTKEPNRYEIEVLDEYKDIYAENEHLIGWLKIDGTKIDDPVMFTPWYQDYYLNRNMQGKKHVSGTLFISQNAVFYPENCNLIIHGHNMANQTRFGSLKRYRHKSYYDTHKIIHFDTLTEKADYIVVAAFYARVLYVNEEGFRYYRQDFFDNVQEFEEFEKNIREMSFYDTGVDIEYGDSFITLSTCSYHTESGRFVVVAKKLSEEERKEYVDDETLSEKK